MRLLPRPLPFPLFLPLLIAAALPAAGLRAQAGSTIVLDAIDSKSMAEMTGENWNDNRVRAYWQHGAQGFVDGFLKFDLTSVPQNMHIVGLRLALRHEAVFRSPHGDPLVQAYRVDDDTWSRANTADVHPGLDELMGGPFSGFPNGEGDLVLMDLDPAAAPISADVVDGMLSIALRNEAGQLGRYSFVYFHGADTGADVAKLEVTYAPGPQLTVTGTCPGVMNIAVSNATPGAPLALVTATATGSFVIPNGQPCAGLTLGLASTGIMLQTTLNANASGSVSINPNVPAAACGNLHLQVIDLVGCVATNVHSF